MEARCEEQRGATPWGTAGRQRLAAAHSQGSAAAAAVSGEVEEICGLPPAKVPSSSRSEMERLPAKGPSARASGRLLVATEGEGTKGPPTAAP
jgi:hypothetical protein